MILLGLALMGRETHGQTDMVCPGSQTLDAYARDGRLVNLYVELRGEWTANTQVTYHTEGSDESGGYYRLPIGTNHIQIEASDDAGHEAQCNFEVVIRGPRSLQIELLAQIYDEWEGHLDDETKRTRRGLEAMGDHLYRTINRRLWEDETHLRPTSGNVFTRAGLIAARSYKLRRYRSGEPDGVKKYHPGVWAETALHSIYLVTDVAIGEAVGYPPVKQKMEADLLALQQELKYIGNPRLAAARAKQIWRKALRLRSQPPQG